MAPYFRFFFEGDGRIGYFMEGGGVGGSGGGSGGCGHYIQLLKVYDGYHDEYNHMAHCVPHYTVLWSRGVVWRGLLPGVPPPNDGQLRSIDQRGLPPHKKTTPAAPAVRLDRRSVESDD
jgi:hypothetical protein